MVEFTGQYMVIRWTRVIVLWSLNHMWLDCLVRW